MRTGLHVQKRLITAPVVHVGLGNATRSEVVRIVWPNGMLQSEFDMRGQCGDPGDPAPEGFVPVALRLERPRDGVRHRRALALAARPAHQRAGDRRRADDRGLGARARRSAAAASTAPTICGSRRSCGRRTSSISRRSSSSIIRPGTEVFVDERFAVPPPALGVTVTGPVQPVAAARDDRGRDVAAVVRDRDDRHLDSAGRGAYQGVTREHFVELTMPDRRRDAGRSGSSRRAGCTRPTAPSTSRSAREGTRDRAGCARTSPIAPAGSGRVRENLGFPAGKDKTVLIDLAGAVRARRASPPAPVHEPGDLLGSTGLGGRPARCACRAASARARLGRTALPRVFAERAARPELAGAAALRARGHDAALARPRGLLHALRRRARAAARRRRSLRHHECRRRAAPAVRRSAAAGGRAPFATSS